jgi:hypothetical protein
VSIVASSSGVRIDCDACRDYASSPDLALQRLRRATGFIRVNGRDLCPTCPLSGAAQTAP